MGTLLLGRRRGGLRQPLRDGGLHVSGHEEHGVHECAGRADVSRRSGYPARRKSEQPQPVRTAPRVVWDPSGDGKQTISAAVGIFYETPKMWAVPDRAPLNPPFGNTIVVNNPASFADPWATYAGGDPFPVQKPYRRTSRTRSSGSFVNMPLDVKPTQFRAVERELRASSSRTNSCSVSPTSATERPTCGSGRKSTRASTSRASRRRQTPIPGGPDPSNPSQGTYFADVPTTDDGATGSTTRMVTALNRRFADNWSLLSNSPGASASMTATPPSTSATPTPIRTIAAPTAVPATRIAGTCSTGRSSGRARASEAALRRR